MKAIPLKGRQVLNPETRRFLPEAGEVVSPDFKSFWLAREADGDVRLTDDDEVVRLKNEWERMLDDAKALNAQADALDGEAKALTASAKSLGEEAKSLRAQAMQKERAAKAALGGKDQ